MNRLKDLREDNDLTQEQVAKILCCAQTTYSRYETGKLGVPIDVLKRLSKFYKVSIDYIVGITNKKK